MRKLNTTTIDFLLSRGSSRWGFNLAVDYCGRTDFRSFVWIFTQFCGWFGFRLRAVHWSNSVELKVAVEITISTSAQQFLFFAGIFTIIFSTKIVKSKYPTENVQIPAENPPNGISFKPEHCRQQESLSSWGRTFMWIFNTTSVDCRVFPLFKWRHSNFIHFFCSAQRKRRQSSYFGNVIKVLIGMWRKIVFAFFTHENMRRWLAEWQRIAAA